MVGETQPNVPCLKLHEVLEQEFQQLHGALPADHPLASDDPRVRLHALWSQAIPGLREKRAALCISGGGIRSATFALGILQGLARCGLLEKFHYLSTVSGGGYIGSWLTAWAHRAEGGLPAVCAQLAQPRTASRPNPEPVEIQNLRSYSNYLSPQLGLLTADTWTLVATYLRNLLLTWFAIVPLLAAALTVPWIYACVLMSDPAPNTALPLWLGAAGVAMSVAYMGISLPCGGDLRRGQGPFLLFCLLPLLLAAIFMTAWWAWFTRLKGLPPAWTFLGLTPPHTVVPFLLIGVGMHLLSYVGSLLPSHGFKLPEFLAVLISGAAGGWLLWLAAVKLFPQPVGKAELYCVFAVPIFLLLFFSAIMVFVGVSSRWTADEDREWWGRAAGWLLVTILVWIAASALVIFGPLTLDWTVARAVSTLTAGGVAGVFTMLAGRSKLIPANAKQADKAGPLALILSKTTSLAALVFAAVLMILITMGTTYFIKELGRPLHFVWGLDTVSGVIGRKVESLNVILYSPPWIVVALALVLALFGVAMAMLINPNKFSLHAMYRDRLIRAYLGASHRTRDPNPFTGFDEKDNVAMGALWTEEKFGKKLLPVVNIALNLVGGSKLAWQERQATSFTVSPLHCGSYEVGYRPTQTEAGKCYGGVNGITLGTAVTISGAAASPNMGYHSSALVTFIMTLLNVRLGAWLGNPGPAGNRTFYLGYPNFSVGPMIAEAFGLTNDTSPYVYLSDGGHFENLGLYEMVLRRCHFIVVSDAGEDPACSFADLGGAVRKIRIDLGIPIEFDEINIFARGGDAEQNLKGRHAAVGRIRYPLVDGPGAEDGVLVYLKPACYGNEPRDIYEYFKSSESFPHESTGDQFFTESQFESYRMLGVHTMERICEDGGCVAGDFRAFVRTILAEHLHTPAPDWLEPLLATVEDEQKEEKQTPRVRETVRL